MSHVELYVVRQNGDIEEYGEAHNAFGGAMHIWMTLREKYEIQGHFLLGFDTLWKSIGNMSLADQWVLASTFDNIILPKEHLTTFLDFFENFSKKYPTETLEEEVRMLQRAQNDPTVYAICFNQTSSNSNPWYVYGEERSYNVNKDKTHQYLTPKYLATF